jgi:membrane carboxypeptidase/penicillin-binding protein PbpC
MHGVPIQPISGGYRGRDPVAVLRIADADGNVLWEYDEDTIATSSTNILAPGLGYLVNDILADGRARWRVLGQNNPLDLTRPAAVVNGITGDRADNWTVGYTPHLAVGVWLGREDEAGMTLDGFGMAGAAPVWRAVMEYAHTRDGLPPVDWQRPPDVVEAVVCERSGLMPNGACPVRNEIFLDGTQPRQPDTTWQTFQMNSATGQLATANTPAELRSERVFFIPPAEAADWWQANNLPLPPVEYDTVSRPELFGSATILQPQAFAYVSGVVEVRGSLDADNLQYYQLAYGQGLNPVAWTDVGEPQTTFTTGNPLGQWNTTGLDGLYNLRLTVVLNDNTVETQVVQVTVDNAPPRLTLSAGEAGQIYRWPADDTVTLTADATDNLALDRVEFYHNGAFLGTDTEWPYGFEWQIPGVGAQTFSATVFDAVGNAASADVSVEVVRGS